jgi:hypothetical protein
VSVLHGYQVAAVRLRLIPKGLETTLVRGAMELLRTLESLTRTLELQRPLYPLVAAPSSGSVVLYQVLAFLFCWSQTVKCL